MIYFNEKKEAFGFEIENPICVIDDAVWTEYAGTDKWDIINGAFTDITDTPEYIAKHTPPEPTPEEIIRGYEDAVQAHLDATAQSRGYDNTYTCLSYLSSTDDIWYRESRAFNAWRDQVWRRCHEILNAVMAGEYAPPSIEELLAMLPVIDWN